MDSAGPALSLRPYGPGDEPAVLALLAADPLPGQAPVTAHRLAEALAGRSPADSGWWAELDPSATDVAVDAHGAVVGVVSYATRRDGVGFLTWLHCAEVKAVADALIAHALDRLDRSAPRTAVYAFEYATALTQGVEGLPVRHRPMTFRALEDAGFLTRDLWRYLYTPLPLPGLPRAVNLSVAETDVPGHRDLEVRENGEVVADATIGLPVDGVGALWWIRVAPSARGRGLGSALLGSALHTIGELGAREVILYVDDSDDADADDHAPPMLDGGDGAEGGDGGDGGDSGNAGDDDGYYAGDGDRTAANRMYDRAGLREVDRLFSFTRYRPGETG
ncbi:GNAT family N-acetyltransferase [Streptomyces sp. NPDC055078]